ncbi:PepSY-associated TM helix domain-containing protein [Noviherbaspirillum sp. CPCC 100848]|uniref:PepSY-associated TM helix domain-containing protein n=1 Tax=Noviherbaspirillum album TaxID=3080276 RepID=A0ABU6JC83_9BURK|nr:PepSY-associated TM helix domain-containing protein [Noviherbaspirillum sp. CPCC 100848]MEC4721247.1 PepSY-associated TM helix domain-containing protein [Noviherbaspirillum sp. CPCC 100848]
MTATAIRRWAWIHKWSSLVCTVFMLLLCLTGLPLIFHHEIGHLLGTEVEAPSLPADAPRVSLDHVLDVAKAQFPGKEGMFVSQEADDDRVWYVTLSDTPTSDRDLKQVAVDARTGEVLAEPKLDEGFIHLMFKLHVDLFAGLPGTLFLGFMGLLLFVAIVSGVVLYAPFMRKLDFGTVRRENSSRIKWLDLHNLLGIVTLVWASVVTLTGVINTLADPLIDLWRLDQVSEMIEPYKGQAPPSRFGSLQQSVDAAMALEPDMKIGFIAFPGTTFTSPHHYGVFLRGDSSLTSRLFRPVLVDAQTTKVTDSRDLPWYVTALLVSQPLHFGDYGGMPMQILWALLDIATILVLGSGLYLWLRRGGWTSSADIGIDTEDASMQARHTGIARREAR